MNIAIAQLPPRQRRKMPCHEIAPSLTGHLRAVHAPSGSNRTQVAHISSIATDTVTFEELAVLVAKKRDKKAFATLFEHFAPRIKSYLMKHGLENGHAEEIAQEVLITFWRKATLFDPQKAKLSTWLFRVARNRMIDLKRKRKYPEVNADDHLAQMVSAERTDRPIEVKQDAKLVASALGSLPENQRKAIELSFFDELSHSQIAEKLSIPLGTVKSRIRIAFNVLRKELGDQG